MNIFDEIKWQFDMWEIEAEQRKRVKRIKREEQRQKELLQHEEKMKKLREDYLKLPPVSKTGLIGMRISSYEQIDNLGFCGNLIEFFFLDGTRCFLTDRKCSEMTQALSYYAPDSIYDIHEALSYIIPSFASGEKMRWGTINDMYYYLQEYVSGTEKNKWSEIDFSKIALDKFVENTEINNLDKNSYKKLEDVINSWRKVKVLRIVGRAAYDGWRDKLKPYIAVIENVQKLECERKEAEAEARRLEQLKKQEEEEAEKRKQAEEKQRKQEAEEKIRQERYLAEKREAEVRRFEQQKKQREEYEQRRRLEEEQVMAEEEEKRQRIIAAGKKGEEEVEYALKWLDKSYYVLNRINGHIKIQNTDFTDEIQEYDHIVVGPTGIILIETKAYSGIINIDQAGNWKRQKDDIWIGIANPIQQVRRHEKMIRSFISSSIPIHNYICIANSSTIIEGSENSIIPIVKCDLLVEYIERQNHENVLSEQQIEECISLINAHMI